MVDSLIKICHIIFFKYIFLKIIFLSTAAMVGGRLAATLSQLNSTFQPTSSHPTYRSNQPNNQGCSYQKKPRVAHGSSMVMFYINSSSDLTLMDHFLFSLLLILHFYPPPPWMVAATLSQLHASNLHQVIQPIDQINQIPKGAHGSRSFISTYHTTWLLRVRNVPTLC